MSRKPFILFIAIALIAVINPTAHAATRTWVGGNDPWDTDIFNWLGNDEPDPDDDAVFNTNNHVEMAIDNEILSLTMSNSIELDTENNFLDVNGDITLSDSGTILRAGESNTIGLPATSVSAHNITVNSGSTYANANFTSFVDPSVVGLFDVNSGGTLFGHGTIRNGDGITAPTVVFDNDGVIRPGTVTDGFILIGGTPAARMLTLDSIDGEGRIDLDGVSGGGAVDVTRNQTLDIDLELNDAFDGVIDLAHNSTLDIEAAWTFSGTMNVENGFVPGQTSPVIIPSIPADVAYLRGGAITMSGSSTTINVLDGDGRLQFDAALTANGGTINNHGLVVFNQDATINSGTDFDMIGVTASMTVGAGATVTINDADMDFDGDGAATNVITVESGGLLDMSLDNFEGNDRADGYLTLNSGRLELTVTDGSWTMERRLTLNNSTGSNPVVSGSSMVVGDDIGFNGAPDADVRVTGNGSSQISVPVTWNSDAEVDVAAGATLAVTGFSTFNTVNGAESARFNGPGNLYFSGGQANEATTLNFSGGTVGLDGGGALVILLDRPDFTINASFTINAAQVDEYGGTSVFPVFSQSELTVNNNAGGRLHVNLDNPADSWTVNNVGVMVANGGNILFSTFLDGNALSMNGTLNVDGLSQSNARLSIGGIVNMADSAANLRLNGGDLINVNRLIGGTVNGPGEISAPNGRALHGYGAIDANIDFDGVDSRLLADDGTLTLTGSLIFDVGHIGTADADGTLEVIGAWNTSAADQVRLNGGVISGGTINNFGVGGVSGRGTIIAPIRNDTFVAADSGGLLQLTHSGSDWHGPTGAGTLRATAGNTLELQDNNAFLFTGTVDANSGTVYANGFELEFDPGSTLSLSNGGTYRSTNATDIGGAVQVGAGAASTLQISGTTVFESGSSTNLTGDLRLDNLTTRILSGATFSGAGSLVNLATRNLDLADGANLAAQIENGGTTQIAGATTVGRADANDFVQSASGLLNVDLSGTGINQWDRLVLNGAAQLAGTLDVDLLGVFTPALGNTFNIITASGGFVGDFGTIVQPPTMPAGLAFASNILGTIYQLEVVTLLPGDFDFDVDVDGHDFLVWQRNTSVGNLADWKSHFGSGIPLTATSTSVPEPHALCLLVACLTIRIMARGV